MNRDNKKSVRFRYPKNCSTNYSSNFQLDDDKKEVLHNKESFRSNFDYDKMR